MKSRSAGGCQCGARHPPLPQSGPLEPNNGGVHEPTLGPRCTPQHNHHCDGALTIVLILHLGAFTCCSPVCTPPCQYPFTAFLILCYFLSLFLLFMHCYLLCSPLHRFFLRQLVLGVRCPRLLFLLFLLLSFLLCFLTAGCGVLCSHVLCCAKRSLVTQVKCKSSSSSPSAAIPRVFA